MVAEVSDHLYWFKKGLALFSEQGNNSPYWLNVLHNCYNKHF